MLAQICNIHSLRHANLVILASAVFSFSSCATKPEPQLISTNTGRESSIPWNQQAKWENQGQLGPMAERLEGR